MRSKEFTENDQKLYIFVLGGKSKKCNIEVHDVRWLVSTRIEDCFNDLRNEWFGDSNGLHIDSYKIVNFVDGYKINIKNKFSSPIERESVPNREKLWFVNLGGYSPLEIGELHKFDLIVATTYQSAIKKAKSRHLKKALMQHVDNTKAMVKVKNVDDCHQIDKIKDWEIVLSKDPYSRSEELVPDWNGYLLIDR